MHSTVHGTGADSVIDKELAEAARVRGLESDGDAEDSDDDTELFSMVEHPKASDTDPNSKRHRRFFYKFLEEVLSSIRSWESNILHYSEISKGGKPGKKSENLPATISFNTMAEGNSCVLSSCGKVHKTKQGKLSRSLIHCGYFANLKLHDKNRLIKSAVVCTKCLITGHKQKECKSNITCSTCNSTTHHALVCRNGANNGGKEEQKIKIKPKKETTILKTDAVESDELPEVVEADVSEDLPVTTNHCLKVFSLTDVKSFLVNKAESHDRKHTMVGTVKVSVGGTLVPTLAIFDNCGSDHWLLHSLAAQLKAKKVSTWLGYVQTMNGRVQRSLDVYEFSVRQIDGNYIKIQAFGTDTIGQKPSIEGVRFDRLLKAFKLSEVDVENPSGNVGLMIGLKSQRLMTAKVKSFYSPEFPDVGLYESSALDKYIFVGASEDQMTSNLMTTCN